ncbi:MAG: NifU family protein [Armatimonadetes bacterium]|nr:NifU family protein [Armatimonadota bacterium]
MREQVEKVIEMIRPALQADGGDIRLVDVADKVVTVELQGACKGCPMSQMTLRMGVERAIKQMVPEVERVEALGLPPGLSNMPVGWGDEDEEEEEKQPAMAPARK